MIQVYCDGACSGNPGPGGWAFVIPALNVEKSGYVEATTNNRMEITAVIEAISYLSSTNKRNYSDRRLEIITDSQYVVNSMTKGWRKLKNTDLWGALDFLLSLGWQITWTWVKGHSDNQYNARCDELAVKEYSSRSTPAPVNTKTVFERIHELPVEMFAKWLFTNLNQITVRFGSYSGQRDEKALLDWLNSIN
jgi:ribonuclease HI